MKRSLSKLTLLLFAPLLLPLGSFAQDQARKVTVTVAAPGYWNDSWRGWHFYEEPEPDDEAVPPPKAITAPSSPATTLRAEGP